MNHEQLKKSGLLEQYVLGLTNREESQLVQDVLANDPEAQKEYELLKEELGGYAESYGLEAPADGRPARTAEDFEELDHEMVIAITNANRSLKRWRLALSAVCLLLLGFSLFIYRQHRQVQSDLVTERAQHAQDQNSFGIELKHLHDEAVDLTKLSTEEIPVDNGLILLHRLAGHDLALLDLSHIEPLEEGDAYYIFLEGGEKSKPSLVIRQQDLHHLHSLELGKSVDTLKIFRWKADEHPPSLRLPEDLIAGLSLR